MRAQPLSDTVAQCDEAYRHARLEASYVQNQRNLRRLPGVQNLLQDRYAENPDPAKKPLLGAPRRTRDRHNYLLTYAQLANRANRQVVFYDQIGCGKSAIPTRETIYTYDLWADEFYTVREALALTTFTCSAIPGGMLGMYCMMKDDAGVNSFVIDSSPVRIQTWLDESEPPPEIHAAGHAGSPCRSECTGNYETPEAKAAADEYYKRHVVGFYEKDYLQFVTGFGLPVGECYMVMQGASEFVVTEK